MVFSINLLDDLVKSDRHMINRCSKKNPYQFRNKRYCCSRPVDFQWKKDGYCYGKTQRCSHEEGCENCKYQIILSHKLGTSLNVPFESWKLLLICILVSVHFNRCWFKKKKIKVTILFLLKKPPKKFSLWHIQWNGHILSKSC